MGFCEFLSESPLGNVGLSVWQSGCATPRGFHVYKGAFAPLLGFSLYRTSCTLLSRPLIKRCHKEGSGEFRGDLGGLVMRGD